MHFFRLLKPSFCIFIEDGKTWVLVFVQTSRHSLTIPENKLSRISNNLFYAIIMQQLAIGATLSCSYFKKSIHLGNLDFHPRKRLHYTTKFFCEKKNLVVLAVCLSLGIKNTGPVVGFEVGLGVNIDLDIDGSSSLLDGVCGDTNWGESTSDELSNSRWAPGSDNISSLQAELGSKNGVLDGSITIDLTERKRLVDRRALVTKSENGSPGVDGNADSKSTGNTRSSRSWRWKVFSGDARNVLKLGSEFSIKGSAGSLRRKKKVSFWIQES